MSRLSERHDISFIKGVPCNCIFATKSILVSNAVCSIPTCRSQEWLKFTGDTFSNGTAICLSRLNYTMFTEYRHKMSTFRLEAIFHLRYLIRLFSEASFSIIII